MIRWCWSGGKTARTKYAYPQVCNIHAQVVRCFEDVDVHHVNGKVDPAEDAETINFELALADIAQIEKRLERLKKGRSKTKEEQALGEVTHFVFICCFMKRWQTLSLYSCFV